MPLSKQAWMALPAAKRGNWSYDKYSNWVKKTAAKRTAKRTYQDMPGSGGVDVGPPPGGYTYQPFHPKNHMNDNFGPSFDPMSDAALHTMASSLITSQTKPLFDRINTQFETRSKEGGGQISRYASDLANSLAPLAGVLSSEYEGAQTKMKAADAGLSEFIKSQAAGLGAQTSASFDGPQAQMIQQGAAGLGGGAALANAGDTSAGLQQLIGDQAAAASYGSVQPAIARQYGLQQLAQFQNQVSSDKANAVGDLTAQIPGMVGDTYQSLLNRELQKATTRADLANQASSRDFNTYQANQSGRQTAAESAMARWQARYGVASDNADRDLTRWTTQQEMGQIDPSASSGLGYTVDSHGNKVAGGKPFAGGSSSSSQQGSFQERYDSARTDAVKQAQGMLNRKVTNAGLTQSSPVPNDRATAAMIAYWRGAFPGMSAPWILARTRESLVAGGYTKAAVDPFLNPGAVQAAGKGQGAQPTTPTGSLPSGPTSEHTAPPTRNVHHTAADAAVAADAAAKKKVKPGSAGRGPAHGTQYTEKERYQAAYAAAKKAAPMLPEAQLRAIAQSAIDRTK